MEILSQTIGYAATTCIDHLPVYQKGRKIRQIHA